MEFVKHNQLLKIRVAYDQDNGYHFEDFIECNDIECLSDWEWLKIANPEEAMEAYQGSYYTGADFARELCEEIASEAMEALPNYLRDCIKWSDVWDYYLRHDYFEVDGLYFRNL